MGILAGVEASASGLTAQRLRLDVIADNIANVNTTRTAAGGPYRKRNVVFMPRTVEFADLLPSLIAGDRPRIAGRGVRVVGIIEDQGEPRMVYDPGHPDADAEGYVGMPNISVAQEMVDLISATRAYQANASAITAARDMNRAALDIGA